VIDYTSDLWPALEAGALDEGYADVMAVLADPPDWSLGEGINGSPTPVRDLTNPAVDTYTDYTMITEKHDGGGIIGKAAFLLSEGGTHNGVIINGIGRTKTTHLFYLVMVSLRKCSVH
jgi:thermolysin